jgi:hypothetical protein
MIFYCSKKKNLPNNKECQCNHIGVLTFVVYFKIALFFIKFDLGLGGRRASRLGFFSNFGVDGGLIWGFWFSLCVGDVLFLFV